jgi:hypothetical protein
MANTTPPPAEKVEIEWKEIPWEMAVDFIRDGQVNSLAQGDLELVLDLHDGSKVIVTIPSEEALDEMRSRCGVYCETMHWLSL